MPDSVVEQKDGVTSPNGAVVWFRDKTLDSQLASLGVERDDITYVAISHTHGDHVGNAKAFAWIGHDKDITAKINRTPKFYE